MSWSGWLETNCSDFFVLVSSSEFIIALANFFLSKTWFHESKTVDVDLEDKGSTSPPSCSSWESKEAPNNFLLEED